MRTQEMLPTSPRASFRAGNSALGLPTSPAIYFPASPSSTLPPASNEANTGLAEPCTGSALTSVEGEGPVGNELARLQAVHERPHPARTAEEGVTPGAQRAQLLHPPFLGASVLEPDLKHTRRGVKPRSPHSPLRVSHPAGLSPAHRLALRAPCVRERACVVYDGDGEGGPLSRTAQGSP